MSTPICVSGVLGLCCVDFAGSTHALPRIHAPYAGAVVGVLGLRSRTRRRDVFSGTTDGVIEPHANPKKPNKPNTLNTINHNPLISLIFECVGFVLGCVNLCWVFLLEGSR